MITIKLKPFDTASGADPCHAHVTAVDVRGRIVGTGELSMPLETIYRMSHFAPERLRALEKRLQELVFEIAEAMP